MIRITPVVAQVKSEGEEDVAMGDAGRPSSRGEAEAAPVEQKEGPGAGTGERAVAPLVREARLVTGGSLKTEGGQVWVPENSRELRSQEWSAG